MLREVSRGASSPVRARRAVRAARLGLALRAGRTAAALSRGLRLGAGAIIGGRIAYALDPTALARLAAGRRTVLVTGTNGKTTTAHLLAAALRAEGAVAHNATGANMADGALAALMERPSARTAVLEVDELHLGEIAAAVCPTAIVLLNLSRDQLDRSTEVAAVAATVREALAEQPDTVVVANCDDPLAAAAALGLPQVRWVSAGATWTQDASLCPRCGLPLERADADWWCPSCGLHRPPPVWTLDDGAARARAGQGVPLTVRLPGDYNLGNALMAIATADLLAVPPERAAAAIADVRSVAHRYAIVQVGAQRLTLLLAKNPAGWREALPLAEGAAALLLVVNAREADGRDTSWLWDVPFERLGHVPTSATGEAAADLGLRLTYAGVDHVTDADPLAALRALPAGDVTVIANYTAFTGLWRRLRGSR